MKSHLLLLACLMAIVVLSSVKAAEIMTVHVQAGRVQEYVNESLRRSYGSDIVDVATDGENCGRRHPAGAHSRIGERQPSAELWV